MSSGTAFFVAPGVLVTNHHVVKECGNDIQVRYPDQASYKATISGLDETNDLVLLRLSSFIPVKAVTLPDVKFPLEDKREE